MKKSGMMLFSGKWMELGIITLKEISQAKRPKCHMFICMQNLDWNNNDKNNGTWM
jgi:hypothetical protein